MNCGSSGVDKTGSSPGCYSSGKKSLFVTV